MTRVDDRLLESGSSFERRLLASSESDMPSDALEQRILAALTSASAPRPDAGAPPPRSAASRWRRSVLIGVGALGLLLGSTIAAREEAPSRPAPPPPSPAVMPPPAEPQEGSTAVPTVSLDALPSAPNPASIAARRPNAPRVTATSKTPTPTARASTLEREVKLLDDVKAKLVAHAYVDASAALDGYDAEFPRGELRPEATVLRVRTLLLLGRRPEAERLAERLLAEHPSNVHAIRIRALLAD